MRLRLLFVLVAMTGVQAHSEIPTLSEVELAIAWEQELLREGNVDTLLHPGARSFIEWSLLRKQSLFALISGNLAIFHERLERLESLDFPKSPSYVLDLAELYSLAVEVGVSSIEAQRFAHAVDVAKREIKHVLTAHGAPPTFDDPRRVKILANLFYYRGDVDALKNLHQRQRQQVKTPDDALTLGYIALVIARLEQTAQSANLVVHHLSPLVDSSDGRFGQTVGFASLYLGEAYLMLAANSTGAQRTSYLERAELLARTTRRSLDLLDLPVFWGLSMELTSDVLASQAELATDPEQRRKLKFLSDRAYGLSIQYH